MWREVLGRDVDPYELAVLLEFSLQVEVGVDFESDEFVVTDPLKGAIEDLRAVFLCVNEDWRAAEEQRTNDY